MASSNSTQPRASTYDDIRYAANAAMVALRTNPNDREASAQLAQLRPYLVQHAQVIGRRNEALNRAEGRQTPSVGGGRVVAFGQGVSSGFGDEIAGAVTPSTDAPTAGGQYLRNRIDPFTAPGQAAADQATAQHRAYLSTARQQDPIGTTLADLAGIIVQAPVAGAALRGAFPGLSRLGEVATRPPTSFLDLLVKTPARVAATAAGAAEIGGQAAVRVAGESDEGNRLRNAAITFPIATAAAMPLSALGVTGVLAGRTVAKAVRGPYQAPAPPPIQVAPRPQQMIQPGAVDRTITEMLGSKPQRATVGMPGSGVRLPESMQPRDPVLRAQLEERVAQQLSRQATRTNVSAPAPTPVSASDVARTAHTQVLEATGDAELAKEAARRAAAMARGSQTVAEVDPLPGLQQSVQMPNLMPIMRIIRGQPTTEGMQELVRLIEPLDQAQRQTITGLLSPAWRRALAQ